MSIIVEVDDNGNIVIPQGLFGEEKPHARYRVEQNGNVLTLVPDDDENRELTGEEWISRYENWVKSVTPKGPACSDSTFSRDELYD